MSVEKANSAVKKKKNVSIDTPAVDAAAAPAKKKKSTKAAETPVSEVKVKKSKGDKKEKVEKKPAVQKEPKAPKEDKATKFLVSLKKSLRKSIKKESAELGISMNDFIVAAIEDKLGRD